MLEITNEPILASLHTRHERVRLPTGPLLGHQATIGCASNEMLQTMNPIINRLGNILGKAGECRCCLKCVLTASASNLFGRLGFIYDKNAT
jgi:hypothetical protein